MRLPRPRVSLGASMVMVGVTAIGSGAWVLRERATKYQEKAQQYERLELNYSRQVDAVKGSIAAAEDAIHKRSIHLNLLKTRDPYGFHEWDEGSLANGRRGLEELRKRHAEIDALANHYAALKNTYQAAASRPWIIPRADPPPPSGWPRVAFWIARREYRRALADLDELIRRDRYDSSLLNTKAWLLATCPEAAYRDGWRAVEAATYACDLNRWNDPNILDTLAAAYAEAGDFEAAVRWQTVAVKRQAPASPERQRFRARLSLYKQRKPYREEPSAD